MEINSATTSSIPTELVKISKGSEDYNLADLCGLAGHFQITGSTYHKENESYYRVHANAIHHDLENKPNNVVRAIRVVVRDQAQRDAYRDGIRNVRLLLLKKYDQNAVDRFDKYFSYRMWAGKPLTVRALNSFIADEDNLRQGTVNISTIKTSESTLECLQKDLQPAVQGENEIIGGSKKPEKMKKYSFCFLPIKNSWFMSAADAVDEKKGREAGVAEAKRAILELIPNKTTQQHVEHLFNAHFAAKIDKKEPLTVRELSAFIDDAIKMRDNENKILGGLYSAATTAQQNGQDVKKALCSCLKDAYPAAGIAAGAAVVANAEAGVNDPITALAKGIVAGSLVTTENDTERILTAVAEHFVASPAAASQGSITSSVLKFFTFGIY